MGIWTWLDRYDCATFERAIAVTSLHDLRDRLSDDSAESRSALGHVAGIHTHRAWHALHVGLTGTSEGGEDPACLVVWGPRSGADVSMTSALFLHEPQTVRDVADYLSALDYDRIVADLYAARDLGEYLYSFEQWQGESDMVECGLFLHVFDEVLRFYVAAAAEGQVVVIRRG